MNRTASSGSVKRPYSGQPGMPCRVIRARAQALSVSIRAAARVGPNAGMPAPARASASPASSGASGPITGEVHAGLDREPDHARHVRLGREQEVAGERGDPRVPRGHDGRQSRRLVPGERGRDRVLPSSATHHQVLHGYVYQY